MTRVSSNVFRRRVLSLTVALTGIALFAACKETTKPCVVTAFSVTPSSATLVVGSQTTLSASSSMQDCTSEPKVSWTSLAPNVATVSGTGQVTGVSAGSASIRATVLNSNASATVTVTQPAVASVQIDPSPATVKLFGTGTISAIARDAQNNPITGRAVTWQSVTPGIVSVSASGVLTGIALGQGTVTATIDGISGFAVVTVGPAGVASVAVTLDTARLTPGQPAQASAIMRDVQNNVLGGRAVSYSSSSPAIATVNPSSGAVVGVAPGTTQITATSEGIAGARTLTVVPPVASVTITIPAGPPASPGTVVNATAVLRDAQGNTLTGRPVSWLSNNPAIATVSPLGVITAVSPGVSTIIASSEGQQGSLQFTVQAPPVATVTVSLGGSTSLSVGASRTATYTARDAQGNVLVNRAAQWHSSNPAVATVHQISGLMTGISFGITNITATVEGISTARELIVVPPAVSTVTVSFSASSVAAGQTSQATAVARDGQGNVMTGRPVTWSSTAPHIATINPSTGVLTAVAPGVTSVRALVDTVSGGADFTVTAAQVASVTVVLNSNSLSVGGTTQATATLRDAQSNVLTGRTVVWSSSSPAIATAHPSTGLVTAVAPGAATIIATSEGVTGQTGVTVTVASVATVEVTLSSNQANRGQNVLASVVARDALGNALPGRSTTWTTTNFAVATLSPSEFWGYCGLEGDPCVFQGSQIVRYGENNIFVYRQFIGSPTYTCGSGFGDPLFGVQKKCWHVPPPTSLSGGSPIGIQALKAGSTTIQAVVDGVQGSAVLTVPNSVPLAWAYVGENGAIVSSTSLANGSINAARNSTGNYTVTFNGMGTQTLGKSFTPHITATSGAPIMDLPAPRTHCSMVSFTVAASSVTVTVRCRGIAGGLAQDVGFNVSVLGDDAFSKGAGLQERLAFSYHGGASGSTYAPEADKSWNAMNGGMSVDMNAGTGIGTFNLGMNTNGATAIFTTTVSQSPADAECEMNSFNGGNGVLTTLCRDKIMGPRSAFHSVLAFENGRGNAFYAFARVVDNVLVDAQTRNTGGSIILVNMAIGRYYVAFPGKSASSYPAIFLTPIFNPAWRRCVHWLQTMNPVTVEVACYDSGGNFANANFNVGFQN